MWVYLKSAFLSIVADRDAEERLLVRARIKGDIERVFPDAQTSHTPKADYHYRASVSRLAVADTLREAALAIDYPNFKARVGADDLARERLYAGVWATTLQGAQWIDKDR